MKNDGQFVATEYFLVKDEKSKYKVVLSENPEFNENFAKDELIYFIKECTGVVLPVVSEQYARAHYNKEHFIVLGNLLEDLCPLEKKLPIEHFIISVKDGNVFIRGGDDEGILYGAYDFLHIETGYECYSQDCFYVDRKVKDLVLYDIKREDGPDFLFREPNYGPLRSNLKTNRRMRSSNNLWIKENGNFIHNSFSEFLPKEKYEEDYPEFYSDGGLDPYHPEYYKLYPEGEVDPDHLQLCYTGHGSEETVDKMRKIVTNRIKELVDKNYSKGNYLHSISFTQEDVRRWCLCPHCQKMREEYGEAYASATVIKFLNPIAREIKKWMAEKWGGRKLNIVMFAYHATINAPVKEENGRYVPIDESVRPEDNIGVFFAPIDMNYHYDFDNEVNRKWLDIFKKWSAVCKNLYLWVYSDNVVDYMMWTDTFNSMQSIYRKAKELNASYIFDQSRYNTDALTAFDQLKMYLNCKLQWNTEDNFDKLVDDFFNKYFGIASEIMKKYFDDYRNYADYQRKTTDISGYIFQHPVKEYFPKDVLERWDDYIQEAYRIIESLKSDEVQYNEVFSRIKKESIAIRFHLLEFYRDTYKKDEKDKLIKEFKEDVKRYGFTLYAEYQSIDSVMEKW